MLREKKWEIYHQFEDEQKRKFLKNLSVKDGFKAFKELYNFASRAGWVFKNRKFDEAKIKHLAKIHTLFGRIK